MSLPAHHHRLLPVALVALGIGVLLQVTDLRSQSGPPAQARVNIDGYEAVAGEVLVQFESPAIAASNQQILGRQVDASENVAVGRRGLRRFRSRAFDVETMIAFFRNQPGVVFVEPNYIVQIVATPDDPEFPNLWGLLNTGQVIGGVAGTPGADISATDAWDVSTGSTSNVIGVIDTGIDYTHPDLAANIWSAPTAYTVTIGGSVINCPAGSHGFNAITSECDPMDDDNHGTHVAGTIGAVGDNGTGVVGVNWTARIIGGKFLDASGFGTTANAVNVIDFMIQTKAMFAGTSGANIRVLNNSWGGGGFSTSLRNAIIDANSANMLFVAAAGNGGSDGIGDNNDFFPFYPASYDVANVVAVASTNNRDFKSGFSNFGATSVDLAAPGSGILSTVIGGGYSSFSGTSMAAPQVSGGAALVLSVCDYTTAQLKDALLSTVDVLGSLAGLVATSGRLNVDNAIRSCGPPPDRPDLRETAVSNPPASVEPGANFSVTDTVENQGAAGAGASTTRFYASLDGSKSGVDILLTGTRSVPALGVGGTSTGITIVTVPNGTAGGDYFLLACTDDTNAVTESDEGNNCRASASTVQVEAGEANADYRVTNVSDPPLSAAIASKFAVSSTTANQGTTDVLIKTKTRYYLSLDGTKSGGDILLKGAQTIPALAAGASKTKVRTVTVKLSTPPGVYFMIACADDTNLVDEGAGEGNNCLTSTGQITITP
jgi:subtilisin family serine protease